METDKLPIFPSLLSHLLMHSALLLLTDAQVSNFVPSFLPLTGFPLCFSHSYVNANNCHAPPLTHVPDLFS